MYVVTFKLTGASPLSMSRVVTVEKKTGEKPDTYEERTWRERIHRDENGEAYMPPTALKNCLESVARFLSESVPGKGMAKYTKHFTAGILVTDPLMLGVKAADIPGERLFVPADGKRGGGKRVWKTFPVIAKWQTEARVYVLDPVLCDDAGRAVLERYAKFAGQFVGLGRFRPERGGFNGRFAVSGFKWAKVADAA